MATDQQDFYAVVRVDSHRNWTPRPGNVTVRKVHERLADAEHEVRQLNATAPTGTVYFIQRTTISHGGRSVAVKPAVVVALKPDRSRTAPAVRKAAAKSKKTARR